MGRLVIKDKHMWWALPTPHTYMFVPSAQDLSPSLYQRDSITKIVISNSKDNFSQHDPKKKEEEI